MRRQLAAAVSRRMPASWREKFIDQVSGGVSPLELAIQFRRLSSDATLSHLGLTAQALGLTSTYLHPEALQGFRLADTDTFQIVSQAESLLYMGNTLLRDADTNGMAHSLEIRVPFLGRDVADFVTGLPGLAKVPRRAPAKHLLRQAVAGILPADLFTRHKRGFTLPVGQWMQGPLRDQCEAAVETLAACPLVDARGTRELWAQYTENPAAVQPSRPMTLVALGSYLARRAEVQAQAG
jgi:asparagine synthase (glutamine-hydrolysing)